MSTWNFWNLVIKSKVPPRSGSSLEAFELHPQKGVIKFFKKRELPENILVKNAKFNVNENLTKQENIDILTKSLLLEAPSIENIYQET